MPKSRRGLRIHALGLCGFLLMLAGGAAAFAQTTDTKRAQNIRNQYLTPQSAPTTAQDLEVMRNYVKNAMDALASRIVALEKSIIDLNAKIRVLEARTTPADSVINEPVSNAKPAGNRGQMRVSMCETGCDASKFAEAVAMLKEGGALTVKPGVYFDCIAIRKSIKLIGEIALDGSHLLLPVAIQRKDKHSRDNNHT